VDEQLLLAALLDSRSAYEAIRGRIALSDFSDFGRIVVREIVRYYRTDPAAQRVERAVLRATLVSAFPNPKQSAAVQDFLDDIPRSKSPGNAADLYLRVRRRNEALHLADLILKGADESSVEVSIQKWQRLGENDNTTDFKPRLTYEDLYEGEHDQSKLAVYPARLNEVFRGGLRRGSAGIIFGRPGAAKTLLTVNMVAGMAHAGHTVLYVGNEENRDEVQRRFVSRLGKTSLWELNQTNVRKEARAYKRAERLALKRGYQNVIIPDTIDCGTTGDIATLIDRLKPDVLVLDQIRHVNQRMDLLPRQEAVTRWLRDTAKAHNLVAIGTAQAGGSGENKPTLKLTDTDFSNTGVQGACDWMIGVGVTEDMERQHKRMLCVVRNKVSGIKKNFPVWLDELHTRVKDKP